MKTIKISLITTFALATCLFISCNQSGQQTSEASATDSTAVQTSPASEKIIAMVVSHHVKDFARWSGIFYDHEPARQAAKLQVVGVFQDFTDPNYVSVTSIVNDLDAAKQFGASEDLKNLMEKAGIIDQPEVKFYEFIYMDTAVAKISDSRMFVIHKVQDYDAWKKVFDEMGPNRKSDGISTIVVARNLDDPNEIAVSVAATDLKVLKMHMEKPEIKEVMQKAGVVGKPTIMLAKKIPSSVI